MLYLNPFFYLLKFYLYEIPPINVRGSGAIPLNSAVEKSNPGF